MLDIQTRESISDFRISQPKKNGLWSLSQLHRRGQVSSEFIGDARHAIYRLPIRVAEGVTLTIAAQVSPEAIAARELAAQHAKPSATYRKLSRQLQRRHAIGDDTPRASNDNFAWPLAKALLAEKNEELLKYAMRYKQIEASANSDARLGGDSVAYGELQLDCETTIRDDGTVVYGKAKQSTSANAIGSTPSRKSTAADETTQAAMIPSGRPWHGDDKVNAMIDDKRTLARLRAKLGPLVVPFEMGVCEGATLQEVGHAAGTSSVRGSMAAGRAIMHLGLITVRDALGELKFSDFKTSG